MSLIGTAIPCSAENIVPINDNLTACASISTNYSKTNIDSKNSAHNLSVQAMNSKSDGIISPQKSKANLKDNPHGKCGDNAEWIFNTNTGELTIYGQGDIIVCPWKEQYIHDIRSVVIENDITGIAVEEAFKDCSNLESVIIGKKVISIESRAFGDCSTLSQVYYLGAIYIESYDNVFEGCKEDLKVAVLNGYYGDNFCGKTVLECLTTGSCGDNAKWILNEDTGVLTIYGTGQISRQPATGPSRNSIKSVVIIGREISCIGTGVFGGCSNLAEITIPGTVTIIGSFSFSGCSSLKSITIPASVESIEGTAFSGCNSLGSIKVNDNPKYTSADGVLFDKDKKILIKYPAKKDGDSYKIPNTVTSIEDAAFEGCINLASVTLGNKIASIGNGVFKNCSALVNIEIPKTVKSIESYAFSGCNVLERVTVDGDLNFVGKEAFSNCPKLSKFEYKGNYAPDYGDKVFDKCRSLGKISVSKNYQGEYKFCEYQTNFKLSFWNTDAGTESAWFIGVTAFVFALIIAVIPAIKKRLREGEPDKRYSPVNAEPDDPSAEQEAELSAFIAEVRAALSSPKGLSFSPASKDTSSPEASSTGGSDSQK